MKGVKCPKFDDDCDHCHKGYPMHHSPAKNSNNTYSGREIKGVLMASPAAMARQDLLVGYLGEKKCWCVYLPVPQQVVSCYDFRGRP